MLRRPSAALASGSRLLAVWLAAVAVAVVLVALRLQDTAERRLGDDAARVARVWALYLGRSVPASPALFRGDAAPAAVAALDGLHRATEVVAFRLWTPDGQPVLESTPGVGGADDDARQTARAVAADGGERVRVQRRADGDVAVGARAWVPVRHGDHLLGVAELEVDLAEAAAATRRAAARAAIVAVAGLLAVGGIGLVLWRLHARCGDDAREHVAYLHDHDPLTGALNRASFVAALGAATRAQRTARTAVLCLDLDRFREFNEWLGRSAGDMLLRQVAARLRATVRDGDLVARLGSDEFAILAGSTDAEAAAALAERIVRTLTLPYEIGERRCEIGASIGIALPAADVAADQMLRRADLALARAKASGRGTFRFYDDRLDDELRRSRRLAVELREALAQRRLLLHYQPLHDAGSGKVVGYEALSRWPHPERGFVPPGEFIALAEQNGLIDELGRWVLEAACAEAARWPEPLRVAVNLSPAQFRHGDSIVETVAAALARSGLRPARLEVEITESLLMSRTEPVLAALHALRARGVRVAMDDFGTGYSSLAHLWRFPFDKVKLDREFTLNLGGDGKDGKVGLIVASVVSMAHALGMRVTAEGVETEAQRAALAGHGCDELQGFLLGRPQPADRLAHRQEPATRDAMAEALEPQA